MIKQGKRVKAGTNWICTHRMTPVCTDKLSDAYTTRINEVLHCLADAERTKPSPPGQSVLIPIKGKAMTGYTYKWLGKNREDKREAIVGVRLDDQHHVSVEIGNHVKGYFHKDNRAYVIQIPPSLEPAFREILARTPGKFIGTEALQPSSGILDQQTFQNHKCIIGLDESGRGSLVGSLVVGGVMITPTSELPEVFDSKDLDRPTRQKILEQIRQSNVVNVHIEVDAATVDKIGITAANALAFDQAIVACETKAGKTADIVLIDGGKLPLASQRPLQFITKGEAVSKAIAAASIIATAIHEQLMMFYRG